MLVCVNGELSADKKLTVGCQSDKSLASFFFFFFFFGGGGGGGVCVCTPPGSVYLKGSLLQYVHNYDDRKRNEAELLFPVLEISRKKLYL